MDKKELSKEHIICGKCGFITFGYEDMIRHLSCTQKYPEENCIEKSVMLKRELEDE